MLYQFLFASASLLSRRFVPVLTWSSTPADIFQVVIGVIASYIKGLNGGSVESRFIYILVIAGISILLSLLWLLPFSGGFHHWPVDLILALTWFAAFGLLIDWADRHNCASNVFKWGGITNGSKCDVWRLSEAFAFLSACFWLASGLLGLWFISRAKKERAAASARASATAG